MMRLRRRPEAPGWDDDGLLTEMRREQQYDAYGPTPAELEALAWDEIYRMQSQHWWSEAQAEYDAESTPARRRGKSGRYE